MSENREPLSEKEREAIHEAAEQIRAAWSEAAEQIRAAWSGSQPAPADVLQSLTEAVECGWLAAREFYGPVEASAVAELVERLRPSPCTYAGKALCNEIDVLLVALRPKERDDD